MKNRRATILSAFLLMPLLASGGGTEAAQPGPGTARRGGGPMMEWHHGTGGCGMAGGMAGGMMGPGWRALDLTRDQRDRIDAVHRDLRARQSALMERMHASMQSARYYRDGKFDEQAARDAYAAAENIHRQMFENMLDAQKRADAVLTPPQRQQLSQANR